MTESTQNRSFFVSYPGPTWRIRGAQNFRSHARPPTDPRSALGEWLAFVDLLEARGASVVPLAPPAVEPALTGLLYAANFGHLFAQGEGRAPLFLVGRLSVSHRAGELPVVRALAESMGLQTREVTARWEGQAEICTLPGHRYILTYGVRSDRESVDEVAALLPPDARTLVVKLREPFFHGDTCLDVVSGADGRILLLAHEGALVDATLADLERFCAPDVEVLAVGEADALAYACNALSLGTDLLSPPGLSTRLCDALAARGITLVETPMTELFGKGGGGPRCLVNDLFGYPAPVTDFAAWRAVLGAARAGYPDVALAQ